MAVVQLRDLQIAQHIEIERQHGVLFRSARMGFQPQRGFIRHLVEGGQEGVGSRLPRHRPLFRIPLPESQEGLVQCSQGAGERLFFMQDFFDRPGGRFAQRGGIHLPGAVHEIVRLVDEKGVSALRNVEKPAEIHLRIEKIIVIPHDTVAPEGGIQLELEGAYAVLSCAGFDRGSGIEVTPAKQIV